MANSGVIIRIIVLIIKALKEIWMNVNYSCKTNFRSEAIDAMEREVAQNFEFPKTDQKGNIPF